MTRLFVAIEIPRTIGMLLEGMGGSLRRARQVPVEQFHITLLFIGDVDSSLVVPIQEILEGIAFTAFAVELSGMGFFPLRGTPRVIYVGVKPTQELERLRNSIKQALTELGIVSDGKRYTPHLTVARVGKTPPSQVYQYAAANNLFSVPPFRNEGFSLFQSQLTKTGAIHTALRHYSL
jgi:2'-5' RNA ligase